ncbi:MAG TPA: M20/M25/M40 family metallo-hydrolase [Candidatus Sulfotelmatobacter sp.]|nr:M20/M25/M40 family metallo-hydrolase [Candidatus Sulfotelmatobacter sp.]
MKPRLIFLIGIFLRFAVAVPLPAQMDDAVKQLARDIYKQLIEINTADSVGNTTVAAEAMAKRLRDAGYSESDIFVGGPNERKGNLVARLHGTGAHTPILLICHLDVVEARREDWSVDPFQFLEKDGYFWGRGTIDVKSGDTFLMMAMIRMKQEGFTPDRDIILALTADEEGGNFNGVDWLIRNHRELIDAEYILNPDAGTFQLVDGKRSVVAIQASEKRYQDYEFKVTNPGGHSSLPVADNAIYHLAEGLTRLERYKFPFELNEVTRAYFERMSGIFGGPVGADMKAITLDPPDLAAIARLSNLPFYNGATHTTCVATRLEAGHANNALPQMARAVVNCRILPGHSSEETRATLERIVADPKISVTPIFGGAGGGLSNPPSPLRADLMSALEKVSTQMWPGVTVVPVMEVGASDGAISRAAGFPTYGISGMWLDVNDDRSHGRDERLPVWSFYDGVEFYYRFLKVLTSPQ